MVPVATLPAGLSVPGFPMSVLFSPRLFLSSRKHLELEGGATGCGNLASCYIVCCPSPLLQHADALPDHQAFSHVALFPPPPPFSIFCSILFHPSSQIPYSDPERAGCSMAPLTNSYLSFKTRPFLVALLVPLENE